VWLRVALLSFGGPAGQIAVVHRILVEAKRCLSETRFLRALEKAYGRRAKSPRSRKPDLVNLAARSACPRGSRSWNGQARPPAIGFFNGVIGAMTGFAGIFVTIWCGLRGWPKDQQRAVFQPVAVAVFVMSAVALGATGAASADIVRLFLLGLPVLLAGTWLGLKLYGHLDEAGFRKLVLVLLLVSGIALVL